MSETRSSSRPLWDLTTRVLHWLLAASVLTCLVTAWLLPPGAMRVHYWSGAVAAGVLVVRLIWGFVGSEFSRLRAFPVSPASLIAHARSVLKRDGRHWPGHPPLGALMALVLLLAVGIMVITGSLELGGREGLGPWRAFISYADGRLVGNVHSLVGTLIAVLIGGHLLGVIVESVLMREDLARSMISGRRKHPTVIRVLGRPRIGLPLAALVLVAGGYGLFTLSERPPHGTHPLTVNADYARECSACHWAFHPSLMPAASWRALTANLKNHFGEDASLSPAVQASISDWLAANASETWDTKAANLLRTVNPAKPYEITATPFWVRRHREIPDAIFKSHAVGSKINCDACHRDAASGGFHIDQIDIPEGAEK